MMLNVEGVALTVAIGGTSTNTAPAVVSHLLHKN